MQAGEKVLDCRGGKIHHIIVISNWRKRVLVVEGAAKAAIGTVLRKRECKEKRLGWKNGGKTERRCSIAIGGRVFRKVEKGFIENCKRPKMSMCVWRQVHRAF